MVHHVHPKVEVTDYRIGVPKLSFSGDDYRIRDQTVFHPHLISRDDNEETSAKSPPSYVTTDVCCVEFVSRATGGNCVLTNSDKIT